MPNPQQSQPPVVNVITNFTTNPTTTEAGNGFPESYKNANQYNAPPDVYCNHSKRECVTGINKVMPTDLDELKRNILDSLNNNRNLRAVGHGCSYSDISLVDKGTIIDTEDLDSLDPDWNMELLNDAVEEYKNKEYVSVKAGTHISELNMLLDSQQKAMIILGGADVQTVGGVISTATHGSGFTFGAIGDYVQSIVIVNESGTIYRIEKSKGITDVDKYKNRIASHDAILKQDDNIFNAVLVSIGCMGVIYSVVIEVRSAFKLFEDKTLKSWKEIKNILFFNKNSLAEYPNVEFAINPYNVGIQNDFEQNVCCLTTIKETTDKPCGNSGMRKLLYVIGSALNITPNLVYGYLKANPNKVPKMLSDALRDIVDDVLGTGKGYIDKSYNVFNKRLGSLVENGVGIEAIVEWEKGVEVLEKLMTKMKELSNDFNKDKNCLYITSPIAVRFVKSSRAYMSMFYHSDPEKVFMVMEIPVISFEKLINDEASYQEDIQILIELQSFLTDDPINARIHWGLSFKEQLNELYARKAYEKYEDFKRVYQALNPKRGFKNNFTTRLGLDFPLDTPHPEIISLI